VWVVVGRVTSSCVDVVVVVSACLLAQEVRTIMANAGSTEARMISFFIVWN
jgi:hypothetical protein